MKLNKQIISSLGFKLVDKTDSPFKDFDMSYYVKNGVVLFFNEGIWNENDYLISVVEQRKGNYNVAAIRWIETVEELIKVYDVITNMSLTEIKNEK